MGKWKDVHTVPNPSGSGWVNEQAGRVVSHHQRKDTAVDHGRNLARATETEHIIHNQDGRIGRRNSYGGDPFPPRDTNR